MRMVVMILSMGFSMQTSVHPHSNMSVFGHAPIEFAPFYTVFEAGTTDARSYFNLADALLILVIGNLPIGQFPTTQDDALEIVSAMSI